MTPQFVAIVIACTATATLIAGIWLVLHLTALTATFAGRADIVATPRPRRATSVQVYAALAVFLLGTVGSVATWSLAMLR